MTEVAISPLWKERTSLSQGKQPPQGLVQADGELGAGTCSQVTWAWTQDQHHRHSSLWLRASILEELPATMSVGWFVLIPHVPPPPDDTPCSECQAGLSMERAASMSRATSHSGKLGHRKFRHLAEGHEASESREARSSDRPLLHPQAPQAGEQAHTFMY